MDALSEVLRVETRSFGVRVVIVQPGAIKRALISPMARIPEGYMSAARPQVVAEAVSRAVNSIIFR